MCRQRRTAYQAADLFKVSVMIDGLKLYVLLVTVAPCRCNRFSPHPATRLCIPSVYTFCEQFENVPTSLGITIMFFLSSATLIKVFSPLNYLRICSDLFSTRKWEEIINLRIFWTFCHQKFYHRTLFLFRVFWIDAIFNIKCGKTTDTYRFRHQVSDILVCCLLLDCLLNIIPFVVR